MDVIVLLDGRNTVTSCLGWQTILNVDAGSVSCLGPYRSTLAEIARMDIEVACGAQVLVRWKQEKHLQLSFFVSRKSKLLISLLPHCVQMTDPLYRIWWPVPCFLVLLRGLVTVEATDPATAHLTLLLLILHESKQQRRYNQQNMQLLTKEQLPAQR